MKQITMFFLLVFCLFVSTSAFAAFVGGFDLKNKENLAVVQKVSSYDLSSVPNVILKSGVLRVGMEPGYMPFEMINKKGELFGFDVDLAKLIAKEIGVRLELVNTAWDRIIPALNSNKFNILLSGMTITEQRAQLVDFTESYFDTGQSILMLSKNSPQVKTYKDLNNSKYKVASKSGAFGEKAVKQSIPHASYRSYKTEAEGIRALLKGKVDAFVYDLPYMSIVEATKGNGQIVFLDKHFTNEPLGIAVNKGNTEFVGWLDQFLVRIKEDGLYSKLYDKWFSHDDWVKDLR